MAGDKKVTRVQVKKFKSPVSSDGRGRFVTFGPRIKKTQLKKENDNA